MRLAKNQRGSAVVEYAMGLSILISAALLGAMLFSNTIKSNYNATTNSRPFDHEDKLLLVPPT